MEAAESTQRDGARRPATDHRVYEEDDADGDLHVGDNLDSLCHSARDNRSSRSYNIQQRDKREPTERQQRGNREREPRVAKRKNNYMVIRQS